MSQRAWILEAVSIGDGDEVLNSAADRIIKTQAAVALLDTSDIATILADTTKIDGAATLGLLGVSNSLAYRVMELERHFHGRERWFGKLAVQTATDWADNNIATPFRCISGLNAYGTDANDEAQVIGTADTPAIAGNVRYDVHRILIVDSNSTTVWKLQVIYGTGTMADAIAAGQYSTIMVKVDAAAGQTPNVPCEIMMPRGACGATKVWVRGWNANNNATLDFYVGWHEYEG